MDAATFMETFNGALAPDLPMRLLRENDRFAVYAGLWSTWVVNGDNRAAKVVVMTVLKPAGGGPAPLGPVSLRDLQPWLVVQLHAVDEENALWDVARKVLAEDFDRLLRTKDERGPKPQWRGGSLDPSSHTHATRSVKEPATLSRIVLEQRSDPDNTDAPRPGALLNRRRVEYLLPAVPDVRVFVEKVTTKQPIQSSMEADAGLVRTGTVLGAINEWRTWFVADGLGPP